MTEQAEAVTNYALQANGSEHIWEHPMMPLKYTDGMKFVASKCEAYWLLDVVGSHQPKLRDEYFQVWRLSKPASEGEPWLLCCYDDSPGRLLVRQEIEYSDFPEDLTPFEFWVEYGTAMLKQER